MVRFVIGVLIGLVLLAAVLAPGATVTAQISLPLENLGLEHLDIVVPDPAASARDHVHPNDAGNAALAAAIDVAVFRR